MVAATFRSVCGIAKETVPGTAVAPTNFIPVTSFKSDLKTKYMGDEGWRGSMVKEYDQILGSQHGEIDFGGNVMPDSLGFLLQSLLPDVVVTGASAPYSSVFSVKNGTGSNGQPVTYTIADYDGIQTRQFPGVKISDLGLKWTADGLFTYTAKGIGLPAVSGSAPTTSYSGVRALPSWLSAVSVGGTARTTADLVLDFSLDIKRPLEVVDAIDGTVAPGFIWAGPVEVSGKLTTAYDTLTDYNAMLNNTQPALSVSFTNGAGATQTGLTLQMSAAAFTAATPSRGKDYVTLEIDYMARANTTDIGATGGYSPLKATLVNAIASGTYA